MAHKVYVVEGNFQIANMFMMEAAFKLASKLRHSDIIVFPGGPDVNPELYKQDMHPTTYCDHRRDDVFLSVWDKVKTHDYLKIGICGGGQFLNVMNGGQMFQNVDNHTRLHTMKYTSVTFQPGGPVPSTGMCTDFYVTSTHHQMMIPYKDAEIWGFANQSTFRDKTLDEKRKSDFDAEGPDIEILWYEKTRSLCFQPHPEYNSVDTKRLFFKCVNRILSAH